MRFRVLLLAGLLLTGCAQADKTASAGPQPAAEAMMNAPARDQAADAAGAPAQSEAAKSPAPGGPQTAPVGPTAPMLAYSYEYQIAASAKAIRALAARHEAACAAAGPTVCQVISSAMSAEGEGEARGSLSLRAQPAWLRRFRDGLGKEAQDAGGEVLSATSSSEDLTRQIVDTEAAMRAKTTLRDRLQGHLANRPGKLSELLELEQALAQVQQEIDAAQSELAVMRTRVATSALTINYASSGIAGKPGAWSPLADALGDIGAMLAGSLSVLVRLVVTALPWVLALGGLLWLFRRRLPAWKRKPPKAAPAAEADKD